MFALGNQKLNKKRQSFEQMDKLDWKHHLPSRYKRQYRRNLHLDQTHVEELCVKISPVVNFNSVIIECSSRTACTTQCRCSNQHLKTKSTYIEKSEQIVYEKYPRAQVSCGPCTPFISEPNFSGLYAVFFQKKKSKLDVGVPLSKDLGSAPATWIRKRKFIPVIG